MELSSLPIKKNINILALGAESAGVFAVYENGRIFISENFGDLLEERNFLKYKKAILEYLRKEKVTPDVILIDLHPLYKTTVFGEELSKKHKIPHIKIQHHIAHIFSVVGDKIIPNIKYQISNTIYGLAMDGTGYGLDGNIWGGEVMKTKIPNPKSQCPMKSQIPMSKIEIIRIGSLEEQIMIGGDLAVKEPARMLIAILAKIPNPNIQYPTKSQVSKSKQIINSKIQKVFVYKFVKKFYTRNEFEVLYNQMRQNFNCQTTTSTGRILDGVAVLLGFAGNERNFKHEATKKLEENSSEPYDDLKPQISFFVIARLPSAGKDCGNLADCAINSGLPRRLNDYIKTPRNDSRWILQTTPLFEYLIKNIHKDKKRLAATAQLYIAKGLYEIIKNARNTEYGIRNTEYAAGGLINNKIISSYLEKQGVYMSKKIPRGDEGVAIGQVVYYLLS